MSGVVVELSRFRSKAPQNAGPEQAGAAHVLEFEQPKAEADLAACTEYLLDRIGGKEEARKIDVWAFVRTEMSEQAQSLVEKSIEQTQQRVEDTPPILWHDCDLSTFLVARDMQREEPIDYSAAALLTEYVGSGAWDYSSNIGKHRVASAIRTQVDYAFVKLDQNHTAQLVNAAEVVNLFASYGPGDYYMQEAGAQRMMVNCLLAKSAILLDDETKSGYKREERAMLLHQIDESLAFCQKINELSDSSA